jgi:hypothetical protein
MLQRIFTAFPLGSSLKVLKYLYINCIVLRVIHRFSPNPCGGICNGREGCLIHSNNKKINSSLKKG